MFVLLMFLSFVISVVFGVSVRAFVAVIFDCVVVDVHVDYLCIHYLCSISIKYIKTTAHYLDTRFIYNYLINLSYYYVFHNASSSLLRYLVIIPINNFKMCSQS